MKVSFPLLITAITAVVRLDYAGASYVTSDGVLQEDSNIPLGFDLNRYIIVSKNDAGKAAVRAAASKVHLNLEKQNAIALSVPSAAIEALRENPDILSVEVDPPRFHMTAEPSQGNKGRSLLRGAIQTTTNSSSSWHHDVHRKLVETAPYGIDLVQARDVTYNPASANAKTICIIDSGYALGHPDLPTDGVTGYEGQNNLPWDQDGLSHGTHVAGTIAALGDNDLGVIGVAPGVDLFIVRTFRGDGDWTYASDLIQALRECELGGADIVSMSLGCTGPCTGSRFDCCSNAERNAFDTAFANGMLPIAAAGNDGNVETLTSYPASYDGVISVAAVDFSLTVASFSQQNDQVELSGPGVAVLSTVSKGASSVTIDSKYTIAKDIDNAAAGTGSGSLVDCGTGNDAACTGSGDFVCLMERGDATFNVKVQNCVNGGGKAAIIFNNVPGRVSPTLGEGNSAIIPAVVITQAEGQFLLENKLDFTAVVTIGGIGYAYYDGTSMATPHVSGVAALVWSNFPDCTAAQIRETLTSTAMDLGAAGRDNAYGFGLVQAKAAIDEISNNGCGIGTCRREWCVAK
jgi:serine protease